MAVKKTTSNVNEDTFDYSIFDVVIERCAKAACEIVCDNVKEVLGLPSSCTYESAEKIEAAEKVAKTILTRAISKIAYQFD